MTSAVDLKKLKKVIESFDKIPKKYPFSHKYHKSKLKGLKLEIRSFLLKIKKSSQRKEILKNLERSLLIFLSLEKPLKKDCEKMIDFLDIKIQDLEFDDEEIFKERIYKENSSFDFHNDLKDIIKRAKKEIFIIEPYIDEDILELTLRGVDSNLDIKILSNSNNPKGKFVKVANKFSSQHKGSFEAREIDKIHDRGVFIDTDEGWVIGQSFKHGGKKPTYLIKLKDSKKLESIYRRIWTSSKKIK